MAFFLSCLNIVLYRICLQNLLLKLQNSSEYNISYIIYLTIFYNIFFTIKYIINVRHTPSDSRNPKTLHLIKSVPVYICCINLQIYMFVLFVAAIIIAAAGRSASIFLYSSFGDFLCRCITIMILQLYIVDIRREIFRREKMRFCLFYRYLERFNPFFKNYIMW